MQHLRSECPLGCHAEQICRTGDVIGRIAIAGVAEIGRQQGQERLYVCLLLMPDGKARDGKPMSQIMRPQALALVETSDLAGSGECVLNLPATTGCRAN